MALVINDRVKETSTTTGTGTFDLGGAVTGFETFVAGIATGNTTYYAIFLQGSTEWEVGLGTVTDATPDTLARTTVITSSNSDSAVNFSAGTKDVFCTLPASKAVYLDASGAAVGAISNVVEDTTPQLGGDLDVNGNAIVSASDGNIAINADGTGVVTMTANSITGDVIPGKLAGTNFTNSLLVGHSTTGTLNAATYNTAVGINAMQAITSADQNTIMGYGAGDAIQTGGYNSFFGMNSGSAAVSGSKNSGFGWGALTKTTGHRNTGIGDDAGENIVAGNNNICIGHESGHNITSGDGNVTIGSVDVASATGDKQFLIADGDDGSVVWITGDSDGTVSANGGELTTTGKAFVMGF
jgi:hypothetical protein